MRRRGKPSSTPACQFVGESNVSGTDEVSPAAAPLLGYSEGVDVAAGAGSVISCSWRNLENIENLRTVVLTLKRGIRYPVRTIVRSVPKNARGVSRIIQHVRRSLRQRSYTCDGMECASPFKVTSGRGVWETACLRSVRKQR